MAILTSVVTRPPSTGKSLNETVIVNIDAKLATDCPDCFRCNVDTIIATFECHIHSAEEFSRARE